MKLIMKLIACGRAGLGRPRAQDRTEQNINERVKTMVLLKPVFAMHVRPPSSRRPAKILKYLDVHISPDARQGLIFEVMHF